jgi:hypothetical protein
MVGWLRFFRRGRRLSKGALNHPDWYPEWRHEAVHQLQDKNATLSEQFNLGSWPRYDYDVDAGTLTFSEGGVVRVIAEIQIAGTTSTKARNWLWAWANSHWPAECVTASQQVKAFGEEHGICELTHEYVDDNEINHLGWELTAVTARVTGALGAYRPPDENGALFLVYKTIAWAS